MFKWSTSRDPGQVHMYIIDIIKCVSRYSYLCSRRSAHKSSMDACISSNPFHWEANTSRCSIQLQQESLSSTHHHCHATCSPPARILTNSQLLQRISSSNPSLWRHCIASWESRDRLKQLSKMAGSNGTCYIVYICLPFQMFQTTVAGKICKSTGS